MSALLRAFFFARIIDQPFNRLPLWFKDAFTVAAGNRQKGIAMQFHDNSSPKDGAHFRMLIFRRISSDDQDEKSLEDQEKYVLQHLNRIKPG
jgi:hypothetical protein